MKVLHITNWYPSKSNPYGALWIKRHIDALPNSVESQIYHLEVKKGRLGFQYSSNAGNHRSFIISFPFLIWKFNEILYYLMVSYVMLTKVKKSNYDVINFHIAYPLLRYFDIIPHVKKIPIIISEHWSAYHYHFNLRGSYKLKAIQRIFNHRVPVITVSKSLGEDIMAFSGGAFENHVLPNVVDTSLFFPCESVSLKQNYFLMVSQWKAPKLPLVAIKAFKKFVNEHQGFRLLIIGYGEQLQEMKMEASDIPAVEFLGSKSSQEIAQYMREARALIHPSEYETFSVVCAEALTCGCPVIASKVGGIQEFVNDNNGILLEETTPSAIEKAMKQILLHPPQMRIMPDFSSKRIGTEYLEIIEKVKNGPLR